MIFRSAIIFPVTSIGRPRKHKQRFPPDRHGWHSTIRSYPRRSQTWATTPTPIWRRRFAGSTNRAKPKRKFFETILFFGASTKLSTAIFRKMKWRDFTIGSRRRKLGSRPEKGPVGKEWRARGLPAPLKKNNYNSPT